MADKRKFWYLAIVIGVLLALFLPTLVWAQASLTIDQVDDNNFPTVTIRTRVVDANGVPIAGLTGQGFQVFEDDKEVKVGTATSAVNPQVTLSVVLVIDVSGSMKGTPLEGAKSSANTLFDHLGDQDRAAVIAFGGKIDLDAVDPAKELDFTTDKGALRNLVNGLEAAGKTPLYDAAFKAVKWAAKEPFGRRVVILFTDGSEKTADERASILQPDDPITEANKNHIPVFTIGLGAKIDREYLERLARMTGGTYRETADAVELGALFQQVVDQMKTQYAVGFTSNISANDANHTLLIKAKTSLGEAEGKTSFVARYPLVPWIRQVAKKEGEQLKPLTDGSEVKGTIIIVPDISARNRIAKVEYLVDGQLKGEIVPPLIAKEPFNFTWNTAEAIPDRQPRTITFTVRAYDDVEPPNMGEKSLSLNVVPGGFVIPVVGVVVEENVAIWGIGVGGGVLLLFLLLLFLVIGLVIWRRGGRERVCPNCGSKLEPGWTSCPFCVEATRPVAVEVPTGAGLISSMPVTEGPTAPGAPGAMPLEPTRAPMGPAMAPVGAPGAAPPVKTELLHKEPIAMAWLIMRKGERPGKEFRLLEGDTSLGREGTCDIVLNDTAVSRQHAKIRLEGKEFFIYDLASANGTLVNGQRITKHLLREGDEVEVGNTVFVFKRVS